MNCPRSFVAAAALAALLGATALTPAKADPATAGATSATVDLGASRGVLAQYGRFVPHARYGEVWVPTAVEAGWKPYAPCHWTFDAKTQAWTYDDQTAWGSIVHHYGRWINDRDLGWAWVPGAEYGSAWVLWQQPAGKVSWMARPPEADLQLVSNDDLGRAEGWWTVDADKLGGTCGTNAYLQAPPAPAPAPLMQPPAPSRVETRVVERPVYVPARVERPVYVQEPPVVVYERPGFDRPGFDRPGFGPRFPDRPVGPVVVPVPVPIPVPVNVPNGGNPNPGGGGKPQTGGGTTTAGGGTGIGGFLPAGGGGTAKPAGGTSTVTNVGNTTVITGGPGIQFKPVVGGAVNPAAGGGSKPGFVGAGQTVGNNVVLTGGPGVQSKPVVIGGVVNPAAGGNPVVATAGGTKPQEPIVRPFPNRPVTSVQKPEPVVRPFPNRPLTQKPGFQSAPVRPVSQPVQTTMVARLVFRPARQPAVMQVSRPTVQVSRPAMQVSRPVQVSRPAVQAPLVGNRTAQASHVSRRF